MSKQFAPFILFPADDEGVRFIQLNEDGSLQLFSTVYPNNRLSLDKVKDEVLAKIGLFYQENFDRMARMPGFMTMIAKLGDHYVKTANAGSQDSVTKTSMKSDDIMDLIDALITACMKGDSRLSKGLFDKGTKTQASGKQPAPADNEPTVAERAVCQDEAALREKYSVRITSIPEHKYRKCLVKYFVNKEFDYDPYGNAYAVIKLPESAIEWTVRHNRPSRSWNVTPEVEGMSAMKTVRFDDVGQVINYIMVNTTM